MEGVRGDGSHTNPAGKHLFVVDIALHPTHQVLNVSRCGHLGRSSVMFRILPQILESFASLAFATTVNWSWTYSSVAFISGHEVGEQNSVIDP